MIPALTKKRQASPANIDKKLTDAVAEVRRLDQRYAELKNQLRKRCDWSVFEAQAKAAATEYAQRPTPENLERLIMSEFVLERAIEKLAPLRNSYLYGDAPFGRFKSEFPDWNAKLVTACSLHLQQAKLALTTVTRQEAERLGSDFSEDEVSSSPLCRRAATAVKHWETQLAGIESAPAESCWPMYAAAMLNHE